MMKKSILSAAVLSLAVTGAANAAREQGGTLTVPIITQTFVADFNPYSGSQPDMVIGTMFEPLWVINTIKGEINWRLAESYAYGDDLKSLTIKLKDGLTWSDGQTLDAEDLLFSLQLGQNDAKLDVTGQWGDGKFESVEMLDNLTVRINFAVADGTIDCICSDHQPHEFDAKLRPFPSAERS